MSAARSKGFTLLELLAAATITVLLAGLLLSVTAGALALGRRAQAGMMMAADAGLALDLLARDLESARTAGPDDRSFAIVLTKEWSELVRRGWTTSGTRLKPAGAISWRPVPGEDGGGTSIAEGRFGLAGAWLRLLAATAESATEPARPRAIAWQIVRRPLTGTPSPANPAPVRYMLFRSAVSAAETFARGYDLTGAGYLSGGEAPGRPRAGSTLTNPAVADVIVVNVIDFGVWLHGRAPGGGLHRLFPRTAGDRELAIRTAVASEEPAVADVMLRVLTDEGALLIEGIETGRASRPAIHASDADWWWAVAESHSRVLVRRVELKGGWK